MVPRPAVVVTTGPVGPGGLLIWTVMVTNAGRPPWPGDVVIPDAESLGLLVPSKVRSAKIAAVETAAATMLGRLDRATWIQVAKFVRVNLGF